MIVIVGGPAGSGKSTVGGLVSEQLHTPFIEGDSLHPQANIDKMSHGIPLTDEDRWGWLEKVAEVSAQEARKSKSGIAVAACSALKKSYRDWIREKAEGEVVVFVFVAVEEQELFKRVQHRQNHFMKADMVHSQLQIMEVPKPDEPNCIVYWNCADVDDCVAKIEKIRAGLPAGK